MKFIVTSDTHSQASGMFAIPLPGALTTRAQHTFDFFEWLIECCKDKRRDISGVLHCGDVHTDRSSIPVPVFNRTFDLMKALADEVYVAMIPGNHDRHSKERAIHSLHAFKRGIENLDVLDEDGMNVQIEGDEGIVDLWGLPSGLDADLKIGKRRNIHRRVLLLHENIIGSAYPSGASAAEGIELKQLVAFLRLHSFDACFCGDIHRPQVLRDGFQRMDRIDISSGKERVTQPVGPGAVVFTGAPFQMDFGDERQLRGVWEWDTKMNLATFIVYPRGPAFLTMDDQQLDCLDDLKPNTYYRFRLRKQQNVDIVRRAFVKAGTANYSVEYSGHTAVSSETKRTEIDGALIDIYVRSCGIKDKELRARLIEKGKGYLSRAIEITAR